MVYEDFHNILENREGVGGPKMGRVIHFAHTLREENSVAIAPYTLQYTIIETTHECRL